MQYSSTNTRFLGQFEPCFYWELNSSHVTCVSWTATHILCYTRGHLLFPLGHITESDRAITSVAQFWLELMECISPKLETFNPLDYLRYGKTDLLIMKIDLLIIKITLFPCTAALRVGCSLLSLSKNAPYWAFKAGFCSATSKWSGWTHLGVQTCTISRVYPKDYSFFLVDL